MKAFVIIGLFTIELFSLVPAWGALPAPIDPSCESSVTQARDPEMEALRLEFIREWADKDFSTPEQNQAWIDAALAPSSVQRIFLQMENWWIKDLNHSILKNKDLVSAFTNYHKKFWLEEWKARLQTLISKKYSDFKTERDFFEGAGSVEIFKAIEETFSAATFRFWSDRKTQAILRAEDLRKPWFALGLGENPDEASLAAKFARKTKKKVAFFWDKEVQEHFTGQLVKIKDLHKELLNLVNDKPLVEFDGKTTNLKLAVFVAARKAHNDHELQRMLIQQFPGVLITPTMAEKIGEFCRMADGFTPPLLISSKEKLQVRDAPFGAISIDFLGLGADNIRVTAQALILAKDLKEAIALARENEKEVTRQFNANKEIIRREFMAFFKGRVTIRFSGDDGIIIPHVEILHSELIRFIEYLSNLFPAPFFRMTLITKDGALGNSSELITQGEEIEKKLRSLILEKAGLELSNSVTMNVFLFDSGGSRKAVLNLGLRRPLSSVEKSQLKDLFPAAVFAVESESNMKASSLRLEPTDIFAVPPQVQ